jgi:tRNA/tmRNA/rRNA uracil-C5-methylase (TrmA/RlmC/RlmD family)
MAKQLKSKTRQCQLTLTVEGIGAEGDGLARDAEALWIVPGGLPGDVVSVSKRGERGRFHVAAERVITQPSPNRVPSFCSELRCGGCSLREHAQAASVQWKRAHVASVLGVEVARCLHGAQTGYRHRIRLHVRGSDVGYFEPGTHRLVSINSCPILIAEFAARVFPLVKALRKDGRLFAELELLYSPGDGRIVAEAVLDKRTEAKLAQEMFRNFLKGGLLDGALEVGVKGETRRHGEPHVLMQHPSDDRARFFLEPGAFSQANVEMNAALVQAVADAVADQSSVLELHAGAGNLTVGYARKTRSAVATEWDAQALMCLRRNVESHALKQVRVVSGGDVSVLQTELKDQDTLIVDPPRTGCLDAAKWVANEAPETLKKIIYVSCDPGSLQRDRKTFQPAFKLVSALAVDMFPGTPHVEVVAIFERQ